MWKRKRLTRRQFMQKCAAAAAAVPYFVPAAALGSRGRPPPSGRLNMGFIGVGNMGGGHLGWFLNNQDVQIRAICDVDARKGAKAVRRVEEGYAEQSRSGLPGRQRRLLRETPLADHPRGARHGQRRPTLQHRLPDRQPAALGRQLPLRV
jgi:hypothetical protein